MKFFLFLLIFVSSLHAQAVNSVGSCQSLFAEEYQPTDFSTSYMGQSFSNQGQYPKWAAVAANFALTLLNRNQNFVDSLNNAFEQIAKLRSRLALSQGSETPSEFGRRRHDTAGTNLLDYDKTSAAPPERIHLSTIIERRFDTEKSLPRRIKKRNIEAQAITNFYTALDSTVFRASEVWQYEHIQKYESVDDGMDDPLIVEVNRTRKRYLIFHLEMDISKELEKDAMKRLNWILENPHESLKNRHDMFIRSMFALYNAMSFTRGSASIAKVFLAASYMHLFGKKIPVLPEDIDVLTMIMTEQDFIRLLEKHFS